MNQTGEVVVTHSEKTTPLIDVSDLSLCFSGRNGSTPALRNVNLKIFEGETLALVGESGSGKSATSLAIMGLFSENSRVTSGRIEFWMRSGASANLLDLNDKELRAIRGSEIAMIFQEPMTALNPSFVVGWQIAEAILLHTAKNRNEAKQATLELLRLVGMADVEHRFDQYPHQLSGGMRQRVMIAMALACRPRLLIADEPTTALDTTVQAQILDLLGDLKETVGAALLLVTHDLGVVSEIADRVAVMYAGEIVEIGTVDAVLNEPLHPYTRALLDALPSAAEPGHLVPIAGTLPDPRSLPSGCTFHPRCSISSEGLCEIRKPIPQQVGRAHLSSCFNWTQLKRETCAN